MNINGIEKEMSIDAVGWSITQEPEHFEDLVEVALAKGPGSWENDAWLPWALKEDLRLKCFKLAKEIVGDKNEIFKLETKIKDIKFAIKQRQYEIHRMEKTRIGLEEKEI